MNWEIKSLSIVELFLDQANIRTPINTSDQRALIEDMFQNENAMQIARSYVENGVFPDEFPIVVKDNDKYIVIEGNRRLASLKALKTPELLSEKYQKLIKKLEYTAIDSINVVVAPSREIALKHIANKHTITLRRNWQPLRQAYFYKSQITSGKSVQELINEYPEHDIVRFIKMIEMHHLVKSIPFSESEKGFLYDERNFPITNLERFYNDKAVQELLEFEFTSNGEVRIFSTKEKFIEKYKIILLDIVYGKIDSRKYNTAEERTKYVKEFPVLEPPKPSGANDQDLVISPDQPMNTRKKTPQTGDGSPSPNKNVEPSQLPLEEGMPEQKAQKPLDSSDFKEQPNDSKKVVGRKSKRIPKTLFKASDLPFRLNSSSLRILFEELKSLEVDKYPNAIHDFLRTFLECSLVVFLKETGDFDTIQKNDKHNPGIGEMLQFIIDGKSSKVNDINLLEGLKLEKKVFDSRHSIARMHNINHNEHFTSSPAEVRSTWALLEGLFKVILNP